VSAGKDVLGAAARELRVDRPEMTKCKKTGGKS